MDEISAGATPPGYDLPLHSHLMMGPTEITPDLTDASIKEKLARERQEAKIRDQLRLEEEERRITKRLLGEAEYRKTAEKERSELIKNRERVLVETAKLEQAEIDRQHRLQQERQQDVWMKDFRERHSVESRLEFMKKDRLLCEVESDARLSIEQSSRIDRKKIRDQEQVEWYEATRASAYYELHRELDEEDRNRRLEVDKLRILDHDRQLEFSLEWARHRKLWADQDLSGGDSTQPDALAGDAVMQRETERVLSEARIKELEHKAIDMSKVLTCETGPMQSSAVMVEMDETSNVNSHVSNTNTASHIKSPSSTYSRVQSRMQSPERTAVVVSPTETPIAVDVINAKQSYTNLITSPIQDFSKVIDPATPSTSGTSLPLPVNSRHTVITTPARLPSTVRDVSDTSMLARVHMENKLLDRELSKQRSIVEQMRQNPTDIAKIIDSEKRTITTSVTLSPHEEIRSPSKSYSVAHVSSPTSVAQRHFAVERSVSPISGALLPGQSVTTLDKEKVASYVHHLLEPTFEKIGTVERSIPVPVPPTHPIQHHHQQPAAVIGVEFPSGLGVPTVAGAGPEIISEVVSEIRRLAEERDVEKNRVEELQLRLVNSQQAMESTLRQIKEDQQQQAEKQGEELNKKLADMNTLKDDRDRAQQETVYLKDQLDRLMRESATLRDDLLDNQSSVATTVVPTVLSSPLRLPVQSMIGSTVLSDLMKPVSISTATLRERVESLTGKNTSHPTPPLPGFTMDTSEFANYPSTSTTGTLYNNAIELSDRERDRDRENISPKRSGSYIFGSSVPRFTRAVCVCVPYFIFIN